MKRNSALAAGICIRIVACAVSFLAVFSADDLRAAEPDKPLTALIGEDAGLCVEFRDLETQLTGFLKSETYRRLSATAVFKAWHSSADHKRLATAIGQVKKVTGQSMGKLASDLFGRSVILAAYPRGNKESTGVLITRARNAEVLDDALAAWRRAAPKDEVKELKFQGQRYIRRVVHKTDGNGSDRKHAAKSVYYVTLGAVFAISDSESAIHDVIGRSQKLGKKTMAVSALYQKARAALAGKPAVTVFFNPRKWDDSVQFRRKNNSANPVVQKLWKQCRSVVAGVRLDGGCVMEVVADFQPEGLPAAWSRLATLTAGASDFLARIPSEAVLAVAGRYDPSLISAAIRINSANRTDKKQWDVFRAYGRAVLVGVDISTELLPNLGPNGGLYVVPRATSNKAVFPFDGLAAFEVVPAADKANPAGQDFRTKLDRGLASGATYLATLYNISVASRGKNAGPDVALVREKKRHGALIRWIDHVGEYRPAVALTEKYLVLASSPDLIEDFVAPARKDRLQADATFQRWKRDYFPKGNQLIFMNLRGLREHVSAVRPVLTGWLAGSDPKSAMAAGQRLDRALDLLGVIDGVFAAAHVGKSQVRLVVGGVVKPQNRKPNAKRD